MGLMTVTLTNVNGQSDSVRTSDSSTLGDILELNNVDTSNVDVTVNGMVTSDFDDYVDDGSSITINPRKVKSGTC